jgi:hypothetical protein
MIEVEEAPAAARTQRSGDAIFAGVRLAGDPRPVPVQGAPASDKSRDGTPRFLPSCVAGKTGSYRSVRNDPTRPLL